MTGSVIVSGIGRSGTTAVFDELWYAMGRGSEPIRVVYEPYVWNICHSGAYRRLTAHDYSMASLNPLGMLAHLETPLMCKSGQQSQYHDNLFDPHFDQGGCCLVKLIRGSGRLDVFAQRYSGARILHIVRNPYDTLNSVLRLFDFFGSEFHKDDRERFGQEIGVRYGLSFDDLSQVEEQLAWWEAMNRAALEAAEMHRNIRVVTYEQYLEDRTAFLQQVCDFLEVDAAYTRPARLTKRIGAVSGQKISLAKSDLAPFAAACDKIGRMLPDGRDEYDRAARAAVQRYADYRGKLDRIPTTRNVRPPNFYLRQLHEMRELLGLPSGTEISAQSMIEMKSHISRLKRQYDQSQRNVRRHKSTLLNTDIRRHAKIASGFFAERQKAPSIGCVITNFNGSKHLNLALSAIAAQNVPFDQVLFVDDCSSDDSTAQIAEFCDRHGHGMLVNDYNLGPGFSRNRGIAALDTDYVMHFDGDDAISRAKCENLHTMLRDAQPDIAIDDHFIVFETDEHVRMPSDMFAKLTSPATRIRYLACRHGPLPRDICMKREIFDATGGYDTLLPVFEDLHFKLRLFSQEHKITYGKDLVGSYYYRRSGGLSDRDKPYLFYWRVMVLLACREAFASQPEAFTEALAHTALLLEEDYPLKGIVERALEQPGFGETLLKDAQNYRPVLADRTDLRTQMLRSIFQSFD